MPSMGRRSGKDLRVLRRRRWTKLSERLLVDRALVDPVLALGMKARRLSSTMGQDTAIQLWPIPQLSLHR